MALPPQDAIFLQGYALLSPDPVRSRLISPDLARSRLISPDLASPPQDAIFLQGTDARAAFRRTLSRRLVSLWAAGHQPTTDVLFRTLPAPLLRTLAAKEAPPASAEEAKQEELIARRRSGSMTRNSKWWEVGQAKRKNDLTDKVREMA